MIPDSSFNLFDYFLGDDKLAEIGSRTAFEFRGRRISYRDLRGETDHWTRRLTACAVAEGDRVAILLFDSPEFIACFLAAAKLGAIAVPINTFLPAEDVAFILSDSGARLLIIESELQNKGDPYDSRLPANSATLVIETESRSLLGEGLEGPSGIVEASTKSETSAFLLYTSGSTGAPKGVLHLHGSIPDTVESYSKSVLGLTNKDRVYSSSRLFFAYGLGNSLSFPLAAGATVILDSGRATPERIAALFAEQKPTAFFGVPAVYLSLLEHRAKGGELDTSSLRLCVSAGEALPPRIFEDWNREVGLPILDGIGSTEMLHIFISNREGEARAGSSGTVVPGYAARVVDDQGSDCELGNLWVRGSSATAGYWNRPDLTRETIQDGWVRTGDVYRLDTEGFFYHVGRSDDCFKVRGLWVSPIEVEAALLAHEAVAEAAVVSAIGQDGLATARAYVVIRAEKQEGLADELIGFVRSRLAAYKAPSRIDFIDEMPRTATGKIQRFRLRAASNLSGVQND
ncbi:MAG: benzoate-CoA ligase family protein [Acidobacteriota bacterium]